MGNSESRDLKGNEHPVARGYVPRGTGTLVRALRKLPQGWTERLNTAMGGDQVFLDNVDHRARAAYERRARGLDSAKGS